FHTSVKKIYWPELLKSCCLMLNSIPKQDEDEPSWCKMHGKELPSNFVQPIGTPAIVFNLLRQRGRKFHPKGEEGLLVGFDPIFLSYRVLIPLGAIVKTKHVQFLKKPDNPAITPTSDDSFEEIKVIEESDGCPQTEEETNDLFQESLNGEENDTNNLRTEDFQFNKFDDEIQNQLVQNPKETVPETLSTRKLRYLSTIRPPDRYGFHHYYKPRTIKSAIRSSESHLWIDAIDAEMDSVERHK
ncbi:uncharacterized protein VP01_7443g1, partial [Puccinia sorghi]